MWELLVAIVQLFFIALFVVALAIVVVAVVTTLMRAGIL